MQLEQALPAQDTEDQAPHRKRDLTGLLTGLLVLGGGGGLTVAWVGFLGWVTVKVTSYVLS